MFEPPPIKTDAQKLKELRELADSLAYDCGHLPYRVMRTETCGRSLFASYEKLADWLQANP